MASNEIHVLVGADQFLVHILTWNLRPNRDVMRRSKARGRGQNGGAGESR